MRRLLYIIPLLLILGCGKENMNPVFNNFPLIGTWISKDGRVVLNIENLKNEGTDEKYYEYEENGMRMLRRTRYNMPVTYQIVFIDGTDLRLADRSGIIELLRASK